MNIIKQALTEADNETYDPVRMVACGSICALIVFQALTLSTFNPAVFGGGVAAILGAIVAQDRLNTNRTNAP